MSTFSPATGSAQLHLDTSYPSAATARVAVVGEVDLATTPVLRERLLRVLRDRGPDLLEVDLAGVTFLDCTGLGTLVAVRNAAIQTGRQVRISRPRPMVRQMLEVTGLLGVFTAPTIPPATLSLSRGTGAPTDEFGAAVRCYRMMVKPTRREARS